MIIIHKINVKHLIEDYVVLIIKEKNNKKKIHAQHKIWKQCY